MKLEDHVERIRLKVEDAVKNALDRCGITADTWDKDREVDSNIEIGDYIQLIESIQSGKDWSHCYDEIVDDYAFTLFNRLICMKVLESHGLYPEMVTQRQQHSGKSYAHYMWLETNGQYSSVPFEGLEKYLSWQFDQLSPECDLFAVSIPLHMIPTATFCKEIIDLINAVDEDDQVENDIWKQGNILSQIYEIYNNSKKAALKASGDKVEYDKVHVQSQIYTPEWVVQFLVDNSLGKLYLEMYPDSDIKNKHKIIGDFSEVTREKKSLDEIKIIDPCVGSGNFLLYCFDLLYEMYMDQIDNYGADYSKRKVPELIIERNLHGIDLDERAVQLTKVGLFIKAKTKRSSVHISHYNIVSASFHLPEYSEIGTLFDAQYFSKQFSDLLKDVWGDLQQAYKFGSLLRIDEKFEDVKKTLKEEIGDAQLSLFTYEKAAEFDLFEKSFYEKLGDAISRFAVDDKKKFLAEAASNALTYLRIIVEKYDIVASNPPYTDSASYSGTELSTFIEINYKKPFNCVSNLYSAFISRDISFCDEAGYIATIEPNTFLTINSFSGLRKAIVNKCHIHILVDHGLDRVNLFGPDVKVDAALSVLQKGVKDEKSIFIDNDSNQQEKYKKDTLLRIETDISKGVIDERVHILNQDEFNKIEGIPFVFQLSQAFRKKFQEDSLISYADVRAGIQTSNNFRFLRMWWEIGRENVRTARNSKARWVTYSKGGPYVKWFGNNWGTIDWEKEGEKLQKFLKENGQDLHAQDYYFKRGITYSALGTKGITFREHSEWNLFDIGGSCVFPTNRFDDLFYLMGLLNSRLVEYILKDCLNPTVNTQPKDLKRLPFVVPDKNDQEYVSNRTGQCVQLKKDIDSNYFLDGALETPLGFGNSFRENLYELIEEEISTWCRILILEGEIDKRICDIYKLDDDDIKRVSDKRGICAINIPVLKQAKQQFASEHPDIDISIIPECELTGKETDAILKLIDDVLFTNNNQMEDFCNINRINPVTIWFFVNNRKAMPKTKERELVFEWFVFALTEIISDQKDGILAINDTDISIVQCLEEYADKKGMTSAQLFQSEEYLGKKIRDYMEKDFFVELMNYTNVFMYLPKTPFIWHLSSGENRGFEAFVSIYKCNADSLYKLKSNYISKRREKLEFRKTQLGDSNTAQILDEKELIDRQLKEIDQFVKKIDELIASGYDPKLDDGVGKNIAPLQEKKMLKADVLNANQLKKYLKAEW